MVIEKLTLKQWRAMRDMSQRELSDKTGITERSIVNCEKNNYNLRNVRYGTVQKICKALDISVDNLFLGDDSENPK